MTKLNIVLSLGLLATGSSSVTITDTPPPDFEVVEVVQAASPPHCDIKWCPVWACELCRLLPADQPSHEGLGDMDVALAMAEPSTLEGHCEASASGVRCGLGCLPLPWGGCWCPVIV